MEILVILIILLIIFYFISTNREGFNARGNIDMPINSPFYGLRGERVPTHPIDDCYFGHGNCYDNSFNPYFPGYAVDGYNCGFFYY